MGKYKIIYDLIICYIKNIAVYQTSLNTELRTDGEHVGLPKGQMGNSEVGHLTIGAGRIIQQELVRISNAVKTGDLHQNSALNELSTSIKQNNGTLHVMENELDIPCPGN